MFDVRECQTKHNCSYCIDCVEKSDCYKKDDSSVCRLPDGNWPSSTYYRKWPAGHYNDADEIFP
jgi:hypothetical protein